MATDTVPKPAAKRAPKPAADPPAAPLLISPPPVIPASANPFIGPLPNNGDAAPKAAPATPVGETGGATKARKGRPRKKVVTDTQIREALSELLTSPGVAFSVMKMDWPANHVFRTGPEFADALVAASLTNQWLRDQLERIARGDTAIGTFIAVFAVVTAGANYLVPLLAYFGVIPQSIGERVAGAPIPPSPIGQHGAPPDHSPFPA